MKILVLAYYITHDSFGGGSGRFFVTAARALKALGHDITLSCVPEKHLAFDYDLIICSHFLHRVQDHPAPIIYVSHGIVPDERLYPGAQHYVSVSKEVQAHNLKHGIASQVIPQPIPIAERKEPGRTLEKILIIRKHETENDPFAFLADKYDVRVSDQRKPIEDQIDWADLCITVGRGALESMSRGKPVLIADNRDYMGPVGDGYVTPENIDQIAKCNFSGRRYKHFLTQEWIEAELARYNPDDSAFLFNYVLINHESQKVMKGYLDMVQPKGEATETVKGLTSIIIPVYNQFEITRECLQSVFDNTDHEKIEIIIIDNGSDIDFCEHCLNDLLPKGFWRWRVCHNVENLGFPAAVNRGIGAANGETIILLNNDVIVTPAWAEIIENALNDYDIIGPVTNYCAGMQRETIGCYTDTQELNWQAEAWAADFAGEVVETTFVIGFCMAFKRSLIDQIGEFDESIWPCSGEEIDFCLRAVAAGKKVAIAKDCYVHHEGSQTFQAMEQAGQINYLDICKRNDNHLAERWGNDFWMRQAVAA